MKTYIFDSKQKLGAAAAENGAAVIRYAIQEKGHANIILATGASQFEMLEHLTAIKDIEWSKVTAYHLDEYIGLSETHPASFRKYLKERFVAKLPSLAGFYFIKGDAQDIQAERRRLGELISCRPVDVAFVGIGENGHLAFNDPPADFETEEPYLIVELDIDCRKQQLSEGWFKTLEEVPKKAVSMSVKQIMKSGVLIVSVPDRRKAKAVKCAVEGEVTNRCPSSILQNHLDCRLFLDTESASLLIRT